jgi:hypothetical protein
MHIEHIATGSKAWKYLILVMFLLAFPGAALAANHYVWCGATGTASGENFTNAYTDLPSRLTRGDTYYAAGSNSCSYGAHTFNDAESGTSVIYILHATASANSGVAGWQSSFSTTPSKWTSTVAHGGGCGVSIWVIERGYYIFDGQFGTISTTEPTMGSFGFWIAKSGDCVNHIYLDGNVNSETLTSLTFNHLEIDGSPLNINSLTSGSEAILTLPKSGIAAVSAMTVYQSYIHDIETGFFQLHSPTNFNVDHSWMARIMYTASAHGNGVAINPAINEAASNLTFSNDTWEDACGTSVITLMNGIIRDLVVYGNTFFETTNTTIFPGGTTPSFCNGDGQIGDLGPGNAITTRALIYNNTFYNNTTGGRSGIFFFNPSATDIVQTNNLFVNVHAVHVTTGGGGDSESYNTAINSSPAGGFACGGTGDSCQGTSKALTSATVTSNVADLIVSGGHGLSLGSPVLVMGSQVIGNVPCGIDTYYPYPKVSKVKSSTEFTYTVQQTVPNATCQAGYGVLFPAPVALPFSSPSAKTFSLSSETADPHLNDGTPLSSPYNFDPLGLTRGQDGTWERGAYESLSSQKLPAAPTGLTAIVQ